MKQQITRTVTEVVEICDLCGAVMKGQHECHICHRLACYPCSRQVTFGVRDDGYHIAPMWLCCKCIDASEPHLSTIKQDAIQFSHAVGRQVAAWRAKAVNHV